jgi:hypothetical protein
MPAILSMPVAAARARFRKSLRLLDPVEQRLGKPAGPVFGQVTPATPVSGRYLQEHPRRAPPERPHPHRIHERRALQRHLHDPRAKLGLAGPAPEHPHAAVVAPSTGGGKSLRCPSRQIPGQGSRKPGPHGHLCCSTQHHPRCITRLATSSCQPAYCHRGQLSCSRMASYRARSQMLSTPFENWIWPVFRDDHWPRSADQEHALAEQGKRGSAVGLALEHLEPVDVALNDA